MRSPSEFLIPKAKSSIPVDISKLTGGETDTEFLINVRGVLLSLA